MRVGGAGAYGRDSSMDLLDAIGNVNRVDESGAGAPVGHLGQRQRFSRGIISASSAGPMPCHTTSACTQGLPRRGEGTRRAWWYGAVRGLGGCGSRGKRHDNTAVPYGAATEAGFGFLGRSRAAPLTDRLFIPRWRIHQGHWFAFTLIRGGRSPPDARQNEDRLESSEMPFSLTFWHVSHGLSRCQTCWNSSCSKLG